MASNADRYANEILRELDKIPKCDAPSCVERAAQPGASCPHGRRLDREAAAKPKERESKDWSTATDAEVRRELRRIGVTG
jgi:hypothetical protein